MVLIILPITLNVLPPWIGGIALGTFVWLWLAFWQFPKWDNKTKLSVLFLSLSIGILCGYGLSQGCISENSTWITFAANRWLSRDYCRTWELFVC
jgi:hypothetical protein